MAGRAQAISTVYSAEMPTGGLVLRATEGGRGALDREVCTKEGAAGVELLAREGAEGGGGDLVRVRAGFRVGVRVRAGVRRRRRPSGRRGRREGAGVITR
eukprot:scaffold28236_cov59-Phaeocystis_antarctica.AAC.2